MSTDPAPRPFDLDAPWCLTAQVSVRPERFGALMYHFGTRRLSFLKSPTLVAAVQDLGNCPTAREALVRSGVPAADLPTYSSALATLAESDMIRLRSAP